MQGLAPVPEIPPEIRGEAAELYRELGGAAFRERGAVRDHTAAARVPAGARAPRPRARGAAPPTGAAQEGGTTPAAATAAHFSAILRLAPAGEPLSAACD